MDLGERSCCNMTLGGAYLPCFVWKGGVI